jgi:hypothetical protein
MVQYQILEENDYDSSDTSDIAWDEEKQQDDDDDDDDYADECAGTIILPSIQFNLHNCQNHLMTFQLEAIKITTIVCQLMKISMNC